ncbi:mannose-6-phosphate isomerase [Johnsonella ignava ATCC 51276]|uniref:Phosphohexomutase n=1 Tax=Johnsonella ignava ATCC 51276 TaxID=679200 RepID=G5GFK4_9FIRM|nr:type I phosphomannose isomerase catalytic subunit [Johnsonella ignava]EHI56481.1 mannose-6-phosphate isomerase [Johnsonella ignava ATCC 51276]
MNIDDEKILFLEPVFKQKIWGGNRINSLFNYNIDINNIGECWGISAHSEGDCIIKNEPFKNMPLSVLWDKRRDLFGNYNSPVFPLLIKFIDANEDLSIQVHPDDIYALSYKNGELGKTECWLVLDCDEDASIVIGHNAIDRDEFKKMVTQDNWSGLIREVPIKKGDFFQINPGCLHAIKKGTLLIETQQSSDLTFRLYDYGRLENGKPRQLHIKECMDCISIPFEPFKNNILYYKTAFGYKIHYIDCKYYSFYEYGISNSAKINMPGSFNCVSVLSGEGRIDDISIKKGDHFILTGLYRKFNLSGSLRLAVSNPN